MERRQFLTGFGAAAVCPLAAFPHAARGQQTTMPVIGYLSAAPSSYSPSSFLKGLSEAGYIEGRNVRIEYRWAYNNNARWPELMADLMRHRVSVIASPGSGLAARAAKEATSTIPIVFGTSIDPVQQGLVASFNRPGANVTGINSMSAELAGKHLGLMHELLPRAARFGALVRADTATGYPLIKDLETAAAALERQIEIIAISTPQDIHAAFANGLKKRSEGLVVTTNPLFGTHRWLIAAMAARHGLPTIHPDRLFAEAGGLMSYGASIANLYRQVGIYTGRVLKGEKPADLPVMQEVRFEFVINLQVAKALDIDIPPALLARADEVIE